MKNILKDKVFWIFFLLVAGFIFVAILNSSKTYEAKSRILFLPKNETAVRNIDQIIENAEQIPFSLSFYNKIVELNSDIEDGALELPDAKRKEFWNAKIQTQQVEKSGVVEITIFDSSQMQASIILDQTIKGILTVMSNYYDVKNNLDMRLIDGPIAQEAVRMNYFQAIIFSIAGGFSAGAFICGMINLLVGAVSGKKEEEVIEEKKEIATKKSFFPKFSFPEMEKKSHSSPEKVVSPFNFKIEEEAALVSPIQPKKFPFFGSKEKKSFAPSNLPVAEEFDLALASSDKIPTMADLKGDENIDTISSQEEEFVLDMGGAKKETPVEMSDTSASMDHKREATPEEVKMRLNKLLSGK